MAANNNLYLQEIVIVLDGQSYSLSRVVLVDDLQRDVRRQTGYVGNVPMRIQRAVNGSIPSLYDDGVTFNTQVGTITVSKTTNVPI